MNAASDFHEQLTNFIEEYASLGNYTTSCIMLYACSLIHPQPHSLLKVFPNPTHTRFFVPNQVPTLQFLESSTPCQPFKLLKLYQPHPRPVLVIQPYHTAR